MFSSQALTVPALPPVNESPATRADCKGAQKAAMIEFFFDCSSPWTYLAFHNIQPMAVELHASISWRPILVGGIFNRINPSVYASRDHPIPAKQNYLVKDIHDWARLADLRIVMPPRIFPVNSVKAMRGCVWLEQPERMLPFARAVFEAYWGREEDIADDAVLTRICQQCGIDPAAFHDGIQQPAIKEALKANAEELMRRGGFGSPTMFLGDDMYFGNDRLSLVRSAILAAR